MPMLAEPRKRKKWILLPKKAPLKPIWAGESEDLTFGQKMMEKMGWSTGKGLGANEQGIQEPLRVSYKNDTKGMGYKLNEEEWISQQDEFNDLLNQLSSETDLSNNKVPDSQNSEIKSLEEKSKQSRNRVHYQKFTRGKDLSRYSENDLACILGLNKIKTEAHTTENNTETKKNDENLFGVKTIHGGSLVDYFKNKLVDLKESNKPSINSTSNIQIDNHYFKNEDENYSVDNFSESEIPIKKKKSKKSKHASPLNDLYSENEVFYENTDDCTKEPSENLKKRKGESSSDGVSKKKIKKVVDITEIEHSIVEIDQNIDSEMCVEEKKCQDIILDAADQTNNEKLSKKKKKCKEISDTNMCTNLANTSNESKKVKKKKNKSETNSEKISSNLEGGIKMKILEKSSTKKDENSTEICNTEYKSAKKKKKSKEKEKNLLNVGSTINHQVKINEQEDYNSDKVEYFKKKKKSKRDVETAIITNTLTCITTEHDAEGKKQIGDNVTTETMEVNIEYEERIEKKKKKRKKDKVADCMNDESVIKNKYEEEFNLSQLDHEEERSKLETPNSVKKKKKRKKDKKEKVIEDNTNNTEENKIDSTNSAKVEHKVKKKKNKNKDIEKIEELESEAICKNKVKSYNGMAEDKNESSNQKRESISRDGNTDAISEKTENELNNLEKNNLADSENNIIHTHKLSLLNRKNKKTNMSLSNMDNSRILQLYCGADINSFRGSNLAHLEGYGKSLTRENVEGLVKQ